MDPARALAKGETILESYIFICIFFRQSSHFLQARTPYDVNQISNLQKSSKERIAANTHAISLSHFKRKPFPQRSLLETHGPASVNETYLKPLLLTTDLRFA